MKRTKTEVEEKSVEIFNLICPLWIGNSMKITSTRTDKDGKTRGVEVVLHCYLEDKTENSAQGQVTPIAFYIWEGQSMCEEHVKKTLNSYGDR